MNEPLPAPLSLSKLCVSDSKASIAARTRARVEGVDIID